ncbi:hypothetical protein ZWY2020_018983 [Hordeum vulgare]|nr:hypothetical protein ZWY2020_018983 [Hordeum vulgare]
MHLTGHPTPSSGHPKAILGTPFPFPRVFSPPHPTGPRRPPHHSDAPPAPAATGLDWTGVERTPVETAADQALRSARAHARRSPLWSRRPPDRLAAAPTR